VDGPGLRAPSVEVVLFWEPLVVAKLAGADGREEVPST
jgi:hypothetical protein